MKITKEKLIYEVNNRILSTNQKNAIKKQFGTVNPNDVDEIIQIAVKTYRKNLIERIRTPEFNDFE